MINYIKYMNAHIKYVIKSIANSVRSEKILSNANINIKLSSSTKKCSEFVTKIARDIGGLTQPILANLISDLSGDVDYLTALGIEEYSQLINTIAHRAIRKVSTDNIRKQTQIDARIDTALIVGNE